MVWPAPTSRRTRSSCSRSCSGVNRNSARRPCPSMSRAQSSAAAESVGLGLYLARGIITRQRGYIALKSEVGSGSTFSVFLPR